MKTLLFEKGTLASTAKLGMDLDEDPTFNFIRFVLESLDKHLSGDFGDMDEEDIEANIEAIEHGLRVFSSYNIPDTIKIKERSGQEYEKKIWIITEADRSSTIILYPSEY